jgi:hypothetical protein
LPDTVLQSLTAAAAKNDPTLIIHQSQSSSASTTKQQQQQQQETGLPSAAGTTKNDNSNAGNSIPRPSLLSTRSSSSSSSLDGPTGTSPTATGAPAQDENSQGGGNATVVTVAPTVAELRKTAEEAIAAVTRKRSFQDRDSGSDGGGDEDNKTTSEGSNRPSYAKRRKKPRLSDCESKLAHLKAENEQLKRHLENVSNKAYKFDKDKEEAGKRIARLMHEKAGPEEMGVAVREFSDMYSDYGVNRQQELSFHLDQLQR